MKPKTTKTQYLKDLASTKNHSPTRSRSNKMKSKSTLTPREARAKRNAARREKLEKIKLESKQESENEDEFPSPETKKRNSRDTPPQTPDAQQSLLPITPTPTINRSSPSSPTVKLLEGVNKSMIEEIENFKNQFSSESTIAGNNEASKPSDEIESLDIQQNTHISGDKPLDSISSKSNKNLQPKLDQFGFKKDAIQNEKSAVDQSNVLKNDDTKSNAKEGKFVTNIAINLLKVEPGTFEKIDSGVSTTVKARPAFLPDVNPHVGTLVSKADGTPVPSKEEQKKIREQFNERQKDVKRSKLANNEETCNKPAEAKGDTNNKDQYLQENDKDEFPIDDENESDSESNCSTSPTSKDVQPKSTPILTNPPKRKPIKRIKKNSYSKPKAENPCAPFIKIVSTSTSSQPLNNNEQHKSVIPYDTATEEDDINTVASGETSTNQTKEDEEKVVPPTFIRYRLAMELEKEDLATDEGKADTTPEERYKEIFISLKNYIKSIDSNAMFISWKVQPTFTVLKVEDKFPDQMEEIASFFNGFRAKLKLAYRHSFRFCIHTPKWSNTWMEMKLATWAQARSYIFAKCNIQSESSAVIGWLVYSFPFTNISTLKEFMMEKTDYEWGFKVGAPTVTDNHIDWKNRMKALEVMVPAEKEEAARQFISALFSPHKKKNEFRTFTDSYLFVGRESEYKSDELAIFHSEMLGRHKFRYTTIEIEQVTSIIRNIDKKVVDKHNQIVSIREMIMNLPSVEQKLVPCKLLLSIDFVAQGEKTWFKNKRGRGGASHYLTFYSWDAGEAVLTAKGLGRYLAHHHGLECVYNYFSADHWEVTKNWKWNPRTNKFDTPEQQHMVKNVLYDPTSQMIQAYNMKVIDDEKKKKAVAEKNQTTSTSASGNKSDDVNQLGTREIMDKPDAIPPVSSADAIKIADEARKIAVSLHSSSFQKNTESTHSPTTEAVHNRLTQNDRKLNSESITEEKDEEEDSSEDEGSEDSSNNSSNQMLHDAEENVQSEQNEIDAQNRIAAIKIMQKELDPDLDSLPDQDGRTAKIQNVFQGDAQSVNSDVTDMTDNTQNRSYHNDNASITSGNSMISDTSLQSLQDMDIQDMIKEGLTMQEIERNVQAKAAHIKLKAQQKADRSVAVFLKAARMMEKQKAQVSSVTNVNEDQSGSDCKAASQP